MFATPHALAAPVEETNCTPLSGIVHDSTAAIVPGASVQLDDTAPVASDSEGHFRIACVPTGKHTLRISFSGFAPLSVTLAAPHPTDLSLALHPEEVETTVEVGNGDESAASANSPTSSGPSQTISGQRLQSLADDPDDLLRELPQMAAAAGGNPSSASLSVDGVQSGDNNGTLPPNLPSPT